MVDPPSVCYPLYDGAQDFNGESSASSLVLEDTNPGSSYSISFWISIDKLPKGRLACLLVNGQSQDDQQPGVYLQGDRIMVKFTVEHSGTETLCSSSALTAKVWTWVSLSISSQNDLIEATLYMNGRFNSQITVKGALATATHGVVTIGKCQWTAGVQATIAEPMFYPTSLPLELWTQMSEICTAKYQESGRFLTEDAYREATEPRVVRGEEPPLIEGHSSNTSGFISFVSSPNKRAKLEAYLNTTERIYQSAEALVDSYDWLMPIFLILRSTHPVIQDNKLEIDRMLPPIIQAKVDITREELLTLAKLTKSHETIEYSEKLQAWSNRDTDDLIAFTDLYTRLKSALSTAPENGDASISKYEKACESFLDTRSVDLEISIDHCVDCPRHQTTTWHDESEYTQLFNNMFKRLQEELPSATVIGNKWGPPSLGVFSVSIEGVGAAKKRDNKGRFGLFKKFQPGNYYREVMDAIYLLAYCYGDFAKMSAEQMEFRRNSPPVVLHPLSHSDLLPVREASPKKVRKNKTGEKEYEPDTVMYCLNWACISRQYIFGKNDRKTCRHHPGRWEFGSVHGLWPENWTCCRRKWDEEGCSLGPHRGIPYTQMPRLCLNHGQVNPEIDCPDSICGKTFIDPSTCGKKHILEPSVCKTHSGYRKFNPPAGYFWTCCNAEAPDVGDTSFCEEQDHRYAEWPEEEAKIYFVTKGVNNPGLSDKRQAANPLFVRCARTSRFFNSRIKPYIDPLERKKTSEVLLQEPRYCLNWGCEQQFKESDNSSKSCKCHTSYYDFGHSGSQISSNKETKRVVLWEPHWRCCGGAWEAPGCTFTKHRGPLLSTMPVRRWKWPAESAKRYFIKKISHIWKLKLDKEHVTKAQISKKYQAVCSEARTPKLPGNYLFRLCMALHLHILCVSPNLSYMFKYQDVVSGLAEQELCGRDGFIEKDAFEKWWFSPLEQIRPQMAV